MSNEARQNVDYASQSLLLKDDIERYYLRRKTLFVNGILLVLLAPVLVALYNYELPFLDIGIYSLFFVFIFAVNYVFYTHPKHFKNLKLAMIITTLATYVLTFSLIIDIQSPSVFTVLFLAYAVVAVYHDKTAIILNNMLLFTIGIFIVLRYPDIFEIAGGQRAQLIYIYVFLLIFVALLSIASFILIKRKVFFYDKLSQMKEVEIRTINMTLELKKMYSQSEFHFEEYYDYLKSFFNALSDKIGIENIFEERIDLIKDLHKLDLKDVVKKSPDIDLKHIEELKRLELNLHSKMHYLMFKSSQTQEVNISDNELFSDNMFPSFKHTFDHKYTKIIAFSAFYTMLKMDKPYLEGLDGKQIRKLLLKDEFFHLIDPDIADIYFNNSKLFDKIAVDAISKRVKS